MGEWSTLRAHKSGVKSIGFSNDGSKMLSGDENGVVCLWSLESKRVVAIWQAHSNALLTTKFFNNTMLTHGRDNQLRLWRLVDNFDYQTEPINSNKCSGRRPWLLLTVGVNSLNFCSIALQNSLLAGPSTVDSNKIDLYSIDNCFELSRQYKQLNVEGENLGAVMALEFVNNTIYAGYESGNIAAFLNGECLFTKQISTRPIIALGSDGENVYTSCAGKTLFKMSLDGDVIKEYRLHGRGATVDVCADLGMLCTAGWDGEVCLFDLELNKLESIQFESSTIAVLKKLEMPFTRRLKRSPDGHLAVGRKDGRICLRLMYV